LSAKLRAAGEDGIQHGLGESPGERVLLARVVAAQQCPTPGGSLSTMSKAWPRTRNFAPLAADCSQSAVPGKGSQGNDRVAPIKQIQLTHEVGQAGVPLLGRRAVGRRSTAHNRGYVGIAQAQAVVPMGALSAVGVAGSMKSRIEPFSGAIAGEHAAGSVCPVRSRSQADDQQAGGRITKAVERSRPVVLASVATWGIGGPRLPPLNQAGTQSTAVDLGRELRQVARAPRRNGSGHIQN